MKRVHLISMVIGFIGILMLDLWAKEALGVSPNPEAKTLKIGVLSNLTGPISTAAIPHTRTTQLAADWINERGGITIKGQKYLIETIVEDIKETVDTAITAAKRLVEHHKVKFTVGLIGPTQIIPVASITEPAKVIRALWHGEGTPAEINPNTPYTFRVPIIPPDFASPLLKYQIKAYPNAKKISLLLIDNPATPFLFEKMKKTAEAHGVNVLGLEGYPVFTRDFYPLLSKVLASKPDAIYCNGLPHHMGGILKSAREMGFNGPIFNLAPTCPNVVRKITGKAFAEDCIIPAPDVNHPEMPTMIKEIRKKLLDKYKECNYDYVRAWDTIWWLVQAIEKAQSLDPSIVSQIWAKMDRLPASTGIGKMGGLQTYGINHIGVLPFAITRMVKGELEHVGWFMPEIP